MVRAGDDRAVVTLCPAQRDTLANLLRDLPMGNVFVVWGGTGKGKTAVLHEAHRTVGGAFLSMKELTAEMQERHPLALEEAFEQLVMGALRSQETVFVDDLHLLDDVVACNYMYQRKGFLNVPLTTLASYAQAAGKRLIFGSRGHGPAPVAARSYFYGIADFSVTDYEHLCRAYLGPTRARRLDYAKIHRFAPKLQGHQLRSSCVWLGRERGLDTDRFIAYLRSQRMASNVDLGEVQDVDLHDLKGVDDVIQSLEASIVLPLENDALATEFDIVPKRGVLLAGPPGTGKTTIGRALAHRLQSKFFLVDGTTISGTREFYSRIGEIFEAAKANAPSIVFIDDSDVIFESGEEMGLYRYLLTILDGLESESAGRVCVMLTAMNVASLPPALVRSGRIELWLETRLPDEAARTEILHDRIATLPAALGEVDVQSLVAATDGFTGADLKRLVEDGKLLVAYDRARGTALRPTTAYFLDAVETVRANKERYQEAESQALRQRPARPPYYDVPVPR
jgi:AAA+ superfamily predicted ATPase